VRRHIIISFRNMVEIPPWCVFRLGEWQFITYDGFLGYSLYGESFLK
jgi:hypothetical protein